MADEMNDDDTWTHSPCPTLGGDPDAAARQYIAASREWWTERHATHFKPDGQPWSCPFCWPDHGASLRAAMPDLMKVPAQPSAQPLSYDQLAEAKKLFEAYERSGEYHDSDASVDCLMSWLEDHFLQLVAWAGQEPMAHQLADADQALTELEMALNNHPMERLAPITVGRSGEQRPLSEYLAPLRKAIDGTDYR